MSHCTRSCRQRPVPSKTLCLAAHFDVCADDVGPLGVHDDLDLHRWSARHVCCAPWPACSLPSGPDDALAAEVVYRVRPERGALQKHVNRTMKAVPCPDRDTHVSRERTLGTLHDCICGGAGVLWPRLPRPALDLSHLPLRACAPGTPATFPEEP